MKNCRPRPGSAYPAFLSTRVVPVAFGLPAEHLVGAGDVDEAGVGDLPGWGTVSPGLYRKPLVSV